MAADGAQRILAQLRQCSLCLTRLRICTLLACIVARRQLQKNFQTDQACAIVK
jgi:hypothetical protein